MSGSIVLADPRVRHRVVVGLVAVVGVLDTLFVVTLATHRFGPDITDVKLMFDLGQERNVPTWANTMLLLAVAASLLLVAGLSRRADRPSARSLAVAGAAVTWLSIDEAAQLHELAGEPTAALFAGWGIDVPTYAWIIPGAVVAGAAAVVAWRWCRTLPPTVGDRLLWALGLYGAAAIGMEGVNGWLVERDAEYPYVAGTLIEESVEMLACVLALTGVARLLEVSDGAIRRRHTPLSHSLDGLRRQGGSTATSP